MYMYMIKVKDTEDSWVYCKKKSVPDFKQCDPVAVM